MKKTKFIFTLMITTAFGVANAYAESFKYVMGTDFYEHPENNTPSLTDNGDGTYSWENGGIYTGVLHNGVFFVTRKDPSPSWMPDPVKRSKYYTLYEYDSVSWMPTKKTDSSGGYISGEYTYQVDGNTITQTGISNAHGYVEMNVSTYTDDYNPFRHNSVLYAYKETNYDDGRKNIDKGIEGDDGDAYISISDGNIDRLMVSNGVINCSVMYSDGKATERQYIDRSKGYFGWGETYNYDEETGKLLNLKNDEGEIIESYSVNADGTITVYSGDKNNGGTLVGMFNSLEEYVLSLAGENLNFTDMLDSNFGKKGYIPSRLQEKHADGSVTIYNADGTIKGFKNKRIYTIDEANAVAKPTGNTVRIKYR